MVSGFVVDTQKANMDTTGRKHRYLEFHIDGGSAPGLGADRWHQINFGTNMTFGLSSETLDTPHNGLLLRFVLGSSEIMLDLGLGGILRYRNLYHHVSGIQLIREVSNNLEIDGHPAKE